jgi:hypothetical protein
MAIETAFERIGARIRLRRAPRQAEVWRLRSGRIRRSSAPPAVAIDVIRDRSGEYFDVEARPDVEFEVLQVDARDRHLLLLTRVDGQKARYLCGHDERHWFVAAVPEARPVSTVRAAKDALRPLAVDGSPFVRQGEWFFVPAPAFRPGSLTPIRRNEPIVRSGGGRPHVAAEAVRSGGVTVYVPSIPWSDTETQSQRDRWARSFGAGVSEGMMRDLRSAHPRWTWTVMRRYPDLYVRGAMRHPDHATVVLHGWHRVYLNTESQARAMSHVVFLD